MRDPGMHVLQATWRATWGMMGQHESMVVFETNMTYERIESKTLHEL